MKSSRFVKWMPAVAGLALILMPDAARACATCYGASDAPMAQGMNWGIMTLLAVIGTVLGGVTTFFVYVGRRASKLSSEPTHPHSDI